MTENISVVNSEEKLEGRGAKVKRAFPTSELSSIDPFLLLDEFFVSPPARFPTHSHKGFEAINFMLEGSLNHEDTRGNSGIIGEGEVQHMITGKGLRHSEMPGDEGKNHGIQLWIDLPEGAQNIEPSYEKAGLENFPVEKNEDKTEKMVIGEGSPLK